MYPKSVAGGFELVIVNSIVEQPLCLSSIATLTRCRTSPHLMAGCAVWVNVDVLHLTSRIPLSWHIDIGDLLFCGGEP